MTTYFMLRPLVRAVVLEVALRESLSIPVHVVEDMVEQVVTAMLAQRKGGER